MAGGCGACYAILFLCVSCASSFGDDFRSGHTNNWAVLICSSRYWFNYRHVANTLSIYRSVKRLGIPDSHIILMLADDMSCNPRNPKPATIVNDARNQIDIYGEDIEVDYRGYEVTVENVIRVLTGRHDPSVPRSKRLLSDDRSNILVYMTGHGGENFLKFQDAEEISNAELADAFGQMWQKRRYHELLFITETCQANSMYRYFHSPNILATGTSDIGEQSYSHHMDQSIGVPVIDRWTYYALDFLEKVTPQSRATMGEFFASFKPSLLHSNPGVRTDLYKRDLRKVLVTDFFGSQRPVELMDGLLQNYNLTASSDEGGKGVGTTSGVQTADEPKAFSMPTGQQAKQLDEHDHLKIPDEASPHTGSDSGGKWRVCETYQVVLAAAAMVTLPVLLAAVG